MQKIKGSCLCGAVSFEVINSFDKLFLCSCNQCRQITGSAFASNLFVATGAFNWLSGTRTITTYRVPGRDISKSFCQVCGSGVPWSGGDGSKMIVPAGALRGEPKVAKKFRILAAEQPLWASDYEHVGTHKRLPE